MEPPGPPHSLLRLLWACVLLAAVAAARDRDCPNCAPVPVAGALPWFTPSNGGFIVTASPRFKNRPLYGAHNGGLVLSGDRPITHLADDTAIYGGLLLGLKRGDVALWAHDAANITSTFAGGAVQWLVSDSHLPGVELRAAVYATSDGVGMVLDANVSDASGTDGGELIWAWGCGAKQSNAVGWAKDPLINAGTLQWEFSPEDCKGNAVALGASNASLVTSFADRSVGVSLATTAASSSVLIEDAGSWANVSSLLQIGGAAAAPAVPPPPQRASALPVVGATLWLRASSLAGSGQANGSSVGAWGDESGLGAVLAQADTARQPLFLADGLGAGAPGVRFDGAATFLASASPAVGAASTMLAVFRDDGSETNCCSGVLFYNGSFNGISTLTAPGAADDDDGGHVAPGAPIVTTLDYAGSPAYGHANVRGRVVAAASLYTAGGPSTSYVDGCPQYTAAVGGTPSAGGVFVGTRNNELARYFRGVLGEVVVFDRALDTAELDAMHAYLYAAWAPGLVPKRSCAPRTGPFAVGRSPLLLQQQPATTAATRFTFAVAANAAPAADPMLQLAAAQARAAALASRATSATPDALLDAALPALSLAVDGLFRATPGAFVHGAMAWDTLYLGWRSEYGATVLGSPELVAQEGRYFFAQQIQESPNARCHSEPSRRLTDEAADSRFHGRGRIDANGNIYDMQSQFFDQQVHLWRWTGNVTHEAALRPALKLHVEWARDSFDADGNGLYQSYTATWPTDSQFYSGGETYETTAYMYRAHLALAEMAARAGNASEAAQYAAVAARIAGAVPSLWVAAGGFPASHREEGGHKRLRPDPWLYSIFLPVEAALWSAETAAQALYFSEWGLERDAIFCGADPRVSNATCGQVCWTSNWVPSMWSVRQLWSGDNSGLALAYFLSGLPDDGYEVLRGNLRRDMLQSAVPGQAGGSNGGTDFNDAVHPAARAIVEGLFGYHPDYVAGVVEVAPQLPSGWPAASFAGAHFALQFATDAAATASLAVQLAVPAPVLVLRLPLRAGALGAVTVTGAPAGAAVSNVTEAGFGQSVLVVRIDGSAAGALVAAVSLRVDFSSALPCAPSVRANATEAAPIALAPPPGLSLFNFSDPQGVLVPGSAVLAGGRLTATVAAGTAGRHLIFGYAATAAGALPHTILFKLDVAAAAPPPALMPPRAALLAATTSWAYVPLGAAANGDLRDIFRADTYVSPRPETCAVRLGSDGWSAWTFPYWNGPWAPQADFANVPNLTVPGGGGAIETPQGARFMLGNVTAAGPASPGGGGGGALINVAFTTLWDNFPANASVPVPPGAAAGAAGAWALVAGSTNPMQTRLANAELRFRYADGSADALQLVPPTNYWALSGWGNNDYDYGSDAFCLPPAPPPTVALGTHNRAMVYWQPLRPGKVLVAVELETLSQEVVVGLLAVSLSRSGSAANSA